MNKKHTVRFEELESQLKQVGDTKRVVRGDFSAGEYVEEDMFLEWQVKTKNLLGKCCGTDSEHYKAFVEEEKPQPFEANIKVYNRLKAVFNAAKEDFEGIIHRIICITRTGEFTHSSFT